MGVENQLRNDMLSDEMCEFIVSRLLWSLAVAVPQAEFYKEFSIGVEYILNSNRQLVYTLIRALARPQVGQKEQEQYA